MRLTHHARPLFASRPHRSEAPRAADGFLPGVNCPMSVIAKSDLLAELERLSQEAKALVAKVGKPEEKQQLLDASLYLQRSVSCARRVKDRLGEV